MPIISLQQYFAAWIHQNRARALIEGRTHKLSSFITVSKSFVVAPEIDKNDAVFDRRTFDRLRDGMGILPVPG
jgi:hypothetical protein